MWFHKEEESTIAVLLAYSHERPDETLTMEFGDGDIYRCIYDTDYESIDDEGDSSCEPDEYQEAAYTVVETVVPGPNYDTAFSTLQVSYKHFPVHVVANDGTILFSAK